MAAVPAGRNGKATPQRGLPGFECGNGLNGFFRLPIAQVQELPDLPAFVAVFQRLARLIVGLAEGMLGITNGFTDGF